MFIPSFLLLFSMSLALAAGPDDCRKSLEHEGPYRTAAAIKRFEGTGIGLLLRDFEDRADVEGAEEYVGRLLRIFERHPELTQEAYFKFLYVQDRARDVDADGWVILSAKQSEAEIEEHLLRQANARLWDQKRDVRDALQAVGVGFRRDFGVFLSFSEEESQTDVDAARAVEVRLRRIFTEHPELARPNRGFSTIKVTTAFSEARDGVISIKKIAWDRMILTFLKKAGSGEGQPRSVDTAQEPSVSSRVNTDSMRLLRDQTGVELSWSQGTDGEVTALVARLLRIFEAHPELQQAGFRTISVVHFADARMNEDVWIGPSWFDWRISAHLRRQIPILAEIRETKARLGPLMTAFTHDTGIEMELWERQEAASLSALAGTVQALGALFQARPDLRAACAGKKIILSDSTLRLTSLLWIDYRTPPRKLGSLLETELSMTPAEVASRTAQSEAERAKALARDRISALTRHFNAGTPRQ